MPKRFPAFVALGPLGAAANVGGDSVSITCEVPLNAMFGYSTDLRAATQGKGTFSMTVDHLEICPPTVQEKVIKDSGFKVAEDED